MTRTKKYPNISKERSLKEQRQRRRFYLYYFNYYLDEADMWLLIGGPLGGCCRRLPPVRTALKSLNSVIRSWYRLRHVIGRPPIKFKPTRGVGGLLFFLFSLLRTTASKRLTNSRSSAERATGRQTTSL